MSWSSGAEVASKIISLNIRYLQGSPKELAAYYKKLIDIFEDFDCDNLFECLGENHDFDAAYKAAYKKRYGTEFGED